MKSAGYSLCYDVRRALLVMGIISGDVDTSSSFFETVALQDMDVLFISQE